MAVYVGQVSHKNGLGQIRNVTATDDMYFALAFGVVGSMGQIYSNRKIGMLQLEGEIDRAEVAIDPSEVMRVEGIDYARSHVSNIRDWGALANSLMLTSRTEMVSKAREVAPTVNINELTDAARGEIAKLLLGVGNSSNIRQIISNDDPSQALLDTVKRKSVNAVYRQTGETGGVEFTITGRGTTAVKIIPSSRLISVRVNLEGNVAGSASAAGSKYKQAFTDIKKEVAKVSLDSQDRNVRYDPNEDVLATAENVYSLLMQTTRQLVRQSVSRITEKFSELENFNPASVKSRLWGELNLTTSEVPQTKLSEDALRAYANGEMTALQFANLPENGLVEKLNKAVNNRLDKADIDAFAERVLERTNPSKKIDEEVRREMAYEVGETINLIQEEVDDTTAFDKAYEQYSRPNQQWESVIIERTMSRLNDEDVDVDNKELIAKRIRAILEPVAYDKAYEQYQAFLTRYKIERNSAADQSQIVQKVVDEYVDSIANTMPEELDDLTVTSVDDELPTYAFGTMEVVLSSRIISEFDFDQAIDESKETLENLLRSTNPYSAVDRIYWRSRINEMRRLKQVAHYANPDHVDEFVEKFAPDWKENIYESNSEFKNRAKSVLKNNLVGVLTLSLYTFIENEGLPEDMTNVYMLVPEKVAEIEMQKAVDDFLDITAGINEDNLSEKAMLYVNENYTEDVLYKLIERNIDLDELVEKLSDRLIDQLSETDEYRDVPSSWWITKILGINNRKELSNIIKSGDVEAFVNKYAPDWKEVAAENKD